MAIIHVFNNKTGQLEQYRRALDEPMPYNRGGTLTVGEYLRASDADIAWTDTDTMEAFNRLRTAYCARIRVVKAFVHPADEGCEPRLQHCLGTALVLRPANCADSLARLYQAALETDAFSYIERPQPEDTDLYLDVRYRPSNYFVGSGLPNLSNGSRSNSVFFLQHTLTLLGHPLTADGIFGERTERAVRDFQRRLLLTEEGIVSRQECESLFNMVCLAG